MKKNHIILMVLFLSVALQELFAANVKVTMNSIAKVMTLVNKETNEEINVGTPVSYAYAFDAAPGTYILTGWDADTHTKDYGTIELTVTNDDTQEFKIFTVTAKVSNSGWVYGTDWTLDAPRCITRDGIMVPVTLSEFTNTSNTKYLLAFGGSTYNYHVIPSEAKLEAGYMAVEGSGTITANATNNTTVPMGGTFTLTYPADADCGIYRKPGGSNGSGSIHYVAFDEIKPLTTVTEGGNVVKTFRLAEANTYNYRLWKKGKRTKAGIFVFYAGSSYDGKVWAEGTDGFSSLTFTNEDLTEDAKWMNTNVADNNKANVANILLTVNERGHLRMKTGQTKDLGAQRDWQLTNSSTANYFIEPDYHYTILNLDGTPGNDVISITKPIKIEMGDNETDGEARSAKWENTTRDFSPWAEIKANKAGSALVLVSYDAISVTQIARSGSGTEKSPYKIAESNFMNGSQWSALWPENTAAFVVTVDDNESVAATKMFVNEEYNTGALKNAGQYVDAEHDVFYYLEDKAGYEYTFTPENVGSVEIAYPTITATDATYSGFGTEGVTKNEDGSYTLLLKKGRQIVCLTGTDGGKAYQVLTAKPCTQIITNKTHDDGKYYPGDEIEVQFAGLYHPANKMSGIYNMSACVTYKDVPDGVNLTLGNNQYQFAGTPAAQLVKTRIPANWNPENRFKMDDAVLQVKGFGDPIGNHRNIDKVAGRSPNFTAISHQTFFGALPVVNLEVSEPDYKTIEFELTPADGQSTIALVNAQGEAFNADGNGVYHVIAGEYTYTIVTEGYKYVKGNISITGQETTPTSISAVLDSVPANGWDGLTIKEPELVSAEEAARTDGEFFGMEGYYKVKNGFHLAWIANNVNVNKQAATNAVLCNDITLSDMPWNTIGNSASTAFSGTFEGNNHTISGVCVEGTKVYTNGLFGYCSNVTLRNFEVEGNINTTATYAGVINRLADNSTLHGITSKVNVNYSGTSNSAYASGLVGWVVCANEAKHSMEQCSFEGTVNTNGKNYAAALIACNTGNYDCISVKDCFVGGSVSGGNYVAGVIPAFGGTNAANAHIENVLVTCELTATGSNIGAISPAANNISNSYIAKALKEGDSGTQVSDAQLASGEIAYCLGQAWGQTIGTDAHPSLRGQAVKYHELSDTYFNSLAPAFELRTLTFEDEDYKGDGSLQATGQPNWSSLIDNPQHGGTLLYGEYGIGSYDDNYYYWNDDKNTMLAHELPLNWDTYCYMGGGHAISHYASGETTTYGNYNNQLTIYKAGVKGLATSGAGHNSSNNFAVHYGHSDNSPYSADNLPYIYFADGEARVIDHMWVTNNAYAINCYLEGNGITSKIGEDDWVKIVAKGDNGKTAEIYLCNGPKQIVTDWTKWDLSSLGAVTRVEFNIMGSNYTDFGLSQPDYFAYDDVAVQFPTGKPSATVNVEDGVAKVTFSGDALLAGQLDEVVKAITKPYNVLDLSALNNLKGITTRQLESYINGKDNVFVIAPANSDFAGTNIINNGTCDELVLTDKADLVLPEAVNAQRVTYTRTSMEGEWKSVVLPFDITVAEGMRVLNNAKIEDTAIVLTEQALGTTIPANTPFIYSVEGEDPIVFAADDATVSVEANPASGVLLGTYSRIPQGSATGMAILNDAGTRFATASETASIPAFRAYVNNSTGSKSFALIINNDLTGVNNINTASDNTTTIYTINGKKVTQPRKGEIYIVNGKKVRM